MSTTKHVAEVIDPVTGNTTILTASSESELEQLVDQLLDERFPGLPPAATPGRI